MLIRTAAILVLLAGMVFTSPPKSRSLAAVYMVNVIADTNDGDCSTACSLRDAILLANASPGADTIVLPAGTFTLSLTGQYEDDGLTGDLDILDDLTISGAGETLTFLDGGSIDRLIHVVEDSGAALSIYMNDLTIRNGDAPVADAIGGGGILNWENITLERVHLSNNTATRGAGLRNSLGSTTIIDSLIDDNTASIEGGGVYSDGLLNIWDSVIKDNQAPKGGGIGNSEEAILRRVEITNNTAGNYGGGVYNDRSLVMTDITLSTNSAEYGGGIYNDEGMELYRATLSQNSATIDGGGLYNDGPATMHNVTFSQNLATGGGGAIYHNNGWLTVLHNTFYFNSASQYGGAFYISAEGNVNLSYSVFGRNSVPGCFLENSIDSNGHNVIDTNACDLTAEGDQVVADVFLGPLQDNGGFSYTHAPSHINNSPAIDVGLDDCGEEDQRRVVRPVDGDLDGSLFCDAGAVEVVRAGFFRLTLLETATEEVDDSLTFVVERYGATDAVSVHFSTATGSARENADFDESDGILSWGTGETFSQTITVDINDDLFLENDEEFTLKLSEPTGGAGILAPENVSTVVIFANDLTSTPEKLVHIPALRR